MKRFAAVISLSVIACLAALAGNQSAPPLKLAPYTLTQEPCSTPRVVFNSTSADGAINYNITAWSGWLALDDVDDGGRAYLDLAPHGAVEVTPYLSVAGATTTFVIYRSPAGRKTDLSANGLSTSYTVFPGDPSIWLGDPYPCPIDSGIEYYTAAASNFYDKYSIAGGHMVIDTAGGTALYKCASIKLSSLGEYAWFPYVTSISGGARLVLAVRPF